MVDVTIRSVGPLVAQLAARAAASGEPVIDLGQGTPTDPTPEVVRAALAGAADAPGYPPAHGTAALRQAYSQWAHRRLHAAVDPEDVIATSGSKELIATLPWTLGLGAGDLVVIPELAYPTYRAGAEFAGCRVLAADALVSLGPQRAALVWLNTPGNPTGKVLPEEHLAKVVAWARDLDALVVSDECYLELGPPGVPPVSVLSPRVARGSYDNVLAVHSLSKRSSMAGYRCGFVAGDRRVIQSLLQRRRDAGFLVAAPVQAAGAAALADDEHVMAAAQRYASRRGLLRSALVAAGFTVDHSEAGLFLWASRGQPDSETAGWFADRGILVAPGGFYGARGGRHVRLALTAPDDRLEAAAARLRRDSRH